MLVHRRVLPWVALAVAALLGVLVLPSGSVAGDGLYLVVAVATAVVAWRGAARAGVWSPALRPIAVGLVLAALGDALYGIQYWRNGGVVPGLTVVDLAWAGCYIAVTIGLLRLVRAHQPGRREDVDGLIDLAAVFVVLLLLAWEFLVAPALADSTLALEERVRASVYPALAAAPLALMVRVFVGRRQLGPMVVVAAVGTATLVVADLGFLITVVGESAWARAGWLLGGMLLATAVHQRAALRDQAVPTVRDPGSGFWRIAVALLPLLVPPLVDLLGHLRAEEVTAVPLFLSMVVLVVLAFARAYRLFQDATAARDLVRAQARFSDALAAGSSDAVVVLDRDGTILREAPQLAVLAGRPGRPTRGRSITDFLPAENLAAGQVLVRRAQEDPREVVSGEIPVTSFDGRELWLGVRIRDLRADPDIRGLVVNLHDITPRKRAEELLAHQALHDDLTGLANRTLFLDRLEHALQRSARTGLDPAVVYLDLDGFKDINDTLGHGAGDRLLEEVATRLQAAVRTVDTVARLGGDEFAVLIEASADPIEEAEVVAARIVQDLREPVDLEERPVRVSASLGIAAGDPLATATSLLRDADIAMYTAKESGRGAAAVFEPGMLSAAVARIAMESALTGALEAGQFHLVYQPVVTLDAERVVGFEALLRWEHPTLGSVPPSAFIPVAESSGLIDEIGHWVIDEACATVAAWQAATPADPPLTIAVNVSGRQLASPALVTQVVDALERTGLEPSSLILEMTETALIQDAAGATCSLLALRELGVRLAIDDFGTGYSSLSYLRQFPIDILKLDRSFVETIVDVDQMPPIVRGLLDLGRTLQLEIVAEGVESGVQRDRLRAERCDLAQGYLFARPMSAVDAERLLVLPVPPHAAAT